MNRTAAMVGALVVGFVLGRASPAQEPVAVESEEPAAAAPPERAWFGAEYLLWKVQSAGAPALAGAVTGIEHNPVRVLPAGAIHPLFGGPAGGTEYPLQSGYRLDGGLWLTAEPCLGVEVGYFQLLQGGTSFAAAARPGDGTSLGATFNDPVVGRDVLILSGISGYRSGGVAVDLENRLWGIEANARYALEAPTFLDRLHLLGGFRFISFSEDLAVATSSSRISGGALPICGCHLLHYEPGVIAPSIPDPVTDGAVSEDRILVHNRFYGPQVGLDTVLRWHALSLTAAGKVGLGVLHTDADLSGVTTLAGAGAASVQVPAGVFVTAANRGRHADDTFAVVPELTLTAGWDLTAHVRLTAGYNFLYLGSASRAVHYVGAVDSRQVPQLRSYDPTLPVDQPPVTVDHAGVWVQGLTAGLQVRF